ncbi:hypothetical protein A2U01_0067082, partial [Trifolium medium]|nr:hypothetical protein [Trifolium medium]
TLGVMAGGRFLFGSSIVIVSSIIFSTTFKVIDFLLVQ